MEFIEHEIPETKKDDKKQAAREAEYADLCKRADELCRKLDEALGTTDACIVKCQMKGMGIIYLT